METIDIHQAKTDLLRLLERVARGGSFIIAKAGRPMAKVVPLDRPEAGTAKRLGFMVAQLRVPADFDRLGERDVETLFGGRS